MSNPSLSAFARIQERVRERKQKWDLRQLMMAEQVSKWSKDPSTKVGAVVTTGHYEPVSWGYNGFPQKMADHPERYEDREEKYSRIVHGEVNALANAAKRGQVTQDCWLYTWPFLPCSRCALQVVQFGIKRVCAPCLPEHLQDRWGNDILLSSEFFHECGVVVITYTWETIDAFRLQQ